MKRFLVKFFVLCALLQLSLILYIDFNDESIFTAEYVRWKIQLDIMDSPKPDHSYNKLLIGDSRINAGIEAKQLPNTYNFGFPGSSVVNSYYSLKRYLNQYPNQIDTVIMGFAPFLLQKGDDTKHFWEYSIKFGLHTLSEIKDISHTQNTFKEYPFGKMMLPKYALYKTKFISYYQSNIKNGNQRRYDLNQVFKKDFKESLGTVDYSSDSAKFDQKLIESAFEDFSCSKVKQKYLNRLVDLCQTNGIKIIYVTLPLNEYSYKNCSESFKKDYKNFIKSIKNQHNEIEVYNELSFMENKYFGDYSHLNPKGARVFTQKLKERFFN